MIKAFIQAAAIMAIALCAAMTTWWTVGPPERSCDPSLIEKGQICLQSIPSDREIVWIDARSRSEWERDGLPGSILWNMKASEDANAMEAEAINRIFTTPYVVIYCNDEGCGTSKKIAKRIRDLDMGAEIYVLHGGWQALLSGGKIPQH